MPNPILIDVTISPSQLNEAVTVWLKEKRGTTLSEDDILSVHIGKDPAPSTVILPPISPPVSTAPLQGPTVPSVAIKSLATVFGLGYKGEPDPEDNGEGAFIDMSTGKPYDTRKVVGVSVPIPILYPTIGTTDKEVVSKKLFTVSIFREKTSQVFPSLAIVDLGPGESVNGQHALLVDKSGNGHYLDRTYPLCKLMNSSDNEEVQWWIEDSAGNPLPFKGLDAPKKVI